MSRPRTEPEGRLTAEIVADLRDHTTDRCMELENEAADRLEALHAALKSLQVRINIWVDK